ncbi:hypothetical protein [Tsuneonella flava]|nr:hypothetical protein [Tsuneonella flava]
MRRTRKAYLAIEIVLFAALVAFMSFGAVYALAGVVSKAWHWVMG